MQYTEGVALVAQILEDLRGEVARDEAKAQEIWDQAALRAAHIDSIEESLKALVTPRESGRAWVVMPGKPCAPMDQPTSGADDVPTSDERKVVHFVSD